MATSTRKTVKKPASKVDQVRHILGLKSNAKKTRKALLAQIQEKVGIKTAGMTSRYYHMVKKERAQAAAVASS